MLPGGESGWEVDEAAGLSAFAVPPNDQAPGASVPDVGPLDDRPRRSSVRRRSKQARRVPNVRCDAAVAHGRFGGRVVKPLCRGGVRRAPWPPRRPNLPQTSVRKRSTIPAWTTRSPRAECAWTRGREMPSKRRAWVDGEGRVPGTHGLAPSSRRSRGQPPGAADGSAAAWVQAEPRGRGRGRPTHADGASREAAGVHRDCRWLMPPSCSPVRMSSTDSTSPCMSKGQRAR